MQQYWVGKGAYRYVGVKEIADAFKEFKTGRANAEALAVPFSGSSGDDPALVKSKYALNSKPSVLGLWMHQPKCFKEQGQAV